MKLQILPDDGLAGTVAAIEQAKTSLDLTIFRFDRPEVEKALHAAVARGVKVRALVAHTNRGGEKLLRKLEQRLLAGAVTVTRTGDELLRYHGKMLIVDNRTLHLLLFNYTALDARSRSFAIVARNRALVAEAVRLFEADAARQPFVAAGAPAGDQSGERANGALGVHPRRAQGTADLRPESERCLHGAGAGGS